MMARLLKFYIYIYIYVVQYKLVESILESKIVIKTAQI